MAKYVDREEVAALKDAGWSADEIAAELGVSRRTVYNYLHKAGWTAPDTTSKDPGKRTLETLYINRNFSAKRIATILKCGHRTVVRWLATHDLYKHGRTNEND